MSPSSYRKRTSASSDSDAPVLEMIELDLEQTNERREQNAQFT